jgi:hypothetical protein
MGPCSPGPGALPTGYVEEGRWPFNEKTQLHNPTRERGTFITRRVSEGPRNPLLAGLLIESPPEASARENDVDFASLTRRVMKKQCLTQTRNFKTHASDHEWHFHSKRIRWGITLRQFAPSHFIMRSLVRRLPKAGFLRPGAAREPNC